MSNSVKMARLDYLSMKSLRTLWVAVLIMVYFGFLNSTLTTMLITGAWFSALMSTSVFSIQEKHNLPRLYSSVSIALRDVVVGRYLFMLVFYAVLLFIGVAGYIAFSFILTRAISFTDALPGIALSLLLFSVITGIQTPLFFKFGYTRARFLSLIPFVLMMRLMSVSCDSTVGGSGF